MDSASIGVAAGNIIIIVASGFAGLKVLINELKRAQVDIQILQQKAVENAENIALMKSSAINGHSQITQDVHDLSEKLDVFRMQISRVDSRLDTLWWMVGGAPLSGGRRVTDPGTDEHA